MGRQEAKVNSQPVCALTVTIVGCDVGAELAGADLKVKCRERGATFMKSDSCRAPAGGGALGVSNLSHTVVYEGDDALTFELCECRRWRSSAAKATGRLSLSTVFGTVGLSGEPGSWAVCLLSEDQRPLASVRVTVSCQCWPLERMGGMAALRSAVAKPLLPPLAKASYRDEMVYVERCYATRHNLQAAYRFAHDAATAPHRLMSNAPLAPCSDAHSP